MFKTNTRASMWLPQIAGRKNLHCKSKGGIPTNSVRWEKLPKHWAYLFELDSTGEKQTVYKHEPRLHTALQIHTISPSQQQTLQAFSCKAGRGHLNPELQFSLFHSSIYSPKPWHATPFPVDPVPTLAGVINTKQRTSPPYTWGFAEQDKVACHVST